MLHIDPSVVRTKTCESMLKLLKECIKFLDDSVKAKKIRSEIERIEMIREREYRGHPSRQNKKQED
jgi:hypothetical protein